MAGLKVKTGDTVEVIAGKDRGARGEVLSVDPARERVIVEGVNVATKHAKPRSVNDPGGIVDKTMPIHVSNVMVVCPKTGQAGRVGYRIESDGTKVRVHKKSGEVLA